MCAAPSLINIIAKNVHFVYTSCSSKIDRIILHALTCAVKINQIFFLIKYKTLQNDAHVVFRLFHAPFTVVQYLSCLACLIAI